MAAPVSSEPILKPGEAFKKRWGVETFFAAFKSLGFNLKVVGCETQHVFLGYSHYWQ
jgi:hypothetical protein